MSALSIYFVQAESGPIKIGTSEFPTTRFTTLQVANFERLTMLTFGKSRKNEEARLHERFSESCIRGEWFRPTPELIQFIDDFSKERGRPMPMSGEGLSEGFKEGWALCLRQDKAHWWKRTPGDDAASMACAPKVRPVRLVNGQLGLFEPGDFPKCGNCARFHAG